MPVAHSCWHGEITQVRAHSRRLEGYSSHPSLPFRPDIKVDN